MRRLGALLLLTFSSSLWAQDNPPAVCANPAAALRDKTATPATKELPDDSQEGLSISFNNFIRAVQDSNLNYAAQKFTVSIAEAQISLARLWPNPTLSGGYTTPFAQANVIPDVPSSSPSSSDQALPNATTLGISEEIPLGGKLGAKEAVATTNASQAQAQLEDYFRNLRGTAAGAYIDAVTAQLNEEQLRKSYKSLQDLADLNEVRYKDGDIAESDLSQARVAALEALSSLHAAESTRRQANIGLAVLAGRREQTEPYYPLGKLALEKRAFNQDSLIADAVEHRSDVIASMHAFENAKTQMRLLLANRVPDVTASLNYTHNSQSENTFAPSPENDQIGFSLSIPLPFSNFDTDDVKAARLTIEQSGTQLAAQKVQAETDVRQAVARYRAALDAVGQYYGGILNDAQRVLDITVYSYRKGSATLLDVRQAESDLTNTYQNYYAALNEEAKALVNLEQMTGFWDITMQ